MRIFSLFFLVVVAALPIISQAKVLHVAIANEEKKDTTDPVYYFEQLIRLALEKTRPTYGDYQIDYQGLSVSSERVRALLIADAGVDIIWASVSNERKDAMQLIPVDILHGLNNYRLLLIRAEDQQTFANVSMLSELRQFTVGDGTHWTDTDIMKANGFTVNLAWDYYSLVKMLAANRFHFIPRGLNDIYDDAERYKQYKLAIEKHLLLKYDRPIEYSFFVNKNNPALAKRIELGLKLAAADGSWNSLFYKMPSFSRGMEELKNNSRVVLTLVNPKD